MITMLDPATKIELSVPAALVERYRAAGYLFKNKADAPTPFSSNVPSSLPEERPLEEWSNKELVAYGASLGLSLRVNASKLKLVAAIREAQEPSEEQAPAVEANEEGDAPYLVTSRNWDEG